MNTKTIVVFTICMLLNIGAVVYYIDHIDSRKAPINPTTPATIKTAITPSQEAAVLAAGINQIIGESRQRDSAIMGEVMRTQHQLKMHTDKKVLLCPDCARKRSSVKERFVSN